MLYGKINAIIFNYFHYFFMFLGDFADAWFPRFYSDLNCCGCLILKDLWICRQKREFMSILAFFDDFSGTLSKYHAKYDEYRP